MRRCHANREADSLGSQRHLVHKEAGGNLGPYQLTTFSLIICILESKPYEGKHVNSVHPSAHDSSAGYAEGSVADTSGLYGRFARTVYLPVTFAAQSLPQHNYPTYSPYKTTGLAGVAHHQRLQDLRLHSAVRVQWPRLHQKTAFI